MPKNIHAFRVLLIPVMGTVAIAIFFPFLLYAVLSVLEDVKVDFSNVFWNFATFIVPFLSFLILFFIGIPADFFIRKYVGERILAGYFMISLMLSVLFCVLVFPMALYILVIPVCFVCVFTSALPFYFVMVRNSWRAAVLSFVGQGLIVGFAVSFMFIMVSGD